MEKRQRLERRKVSMSSVREKRGQKERNGERQKVKPETRPVLLQSETPPSSPAETPENLRDQLLADETH